VPHWTDTTAYVNLPAPDDADVLPIADMSLAEGSRQRTVTVGTLRALAGGLTPIRVAAGSTTVTAADLGRQVRVIGAGAVDFADGLPQGFYCVVGNNTVSDVVTLDDDGVTLLSAGVSIANGKWVAVLVVDVNVIEAVGAFVDDPAAAATTLAALTDVDLTGLSDGDVLVYDSGTSEWIAAAPTGGSGSPGGSDTQIQYNDGGAFAGLTGFMLQKANPRMKIEKTLSTPANTEADDALHVTLTKSGNATQVPSAFHVYAKSGGGGAGTGNLHAISAHIDAFNPTNTTDEATPLFTLMTAVRGRLWGTDQNVVGPSATQAHTILGASVNVMNQNSSAATGKVVGLNLTTVKENEAQATAPTWPGDFGVLVNGRSGDAGNTRAGWTVGIGVGQAGGGWHAATVGKVTTGIEVTNTDSLGISYVGTVAAAVGLRVKGATSQSGNLIEVRASDDTIPARFAAAGNLAFLFGAATDPFLSTSVTGDSQSRFVVQTGGKIEWGPGSAARDVFLSRTAVTGGTPLEIESAALTELRLWTNTGGNTSKSSIQQTANNGNLYLYANGRFDGTNFVRDDTAQGLSAIQISAAGGVLFRGAAAGSNPATLTTHFHVTALGNVVTRQASLATSATDGFLYIPSMAGNPSGTPTAYTSAAAMVLDSTNNRLYVRNGATWRYATLT